MATMVMFRGEQCWVNSAYSVQLFTEENTDLYPNILWELVPVESASVGGKYRGAFVKTYLFRFLPSSMDFSSSEWSVGVSNGQAK